MKIAIIGGTRFIGPYVVKKLHAQGHGLLLFHRGKSKADIPSEIQHLYGDRNCLGDFLNDFRTYDPEIVLDMAPITEIHARKLMEVFKDIADRVVSISSQDVYRSYGLMLGIEAGDAQPMPMSEDAALRTKFYPYRQEQPRPEEDPRKILDDYDKIPIEKVVMDDPDLPGTVLRLPMVYGPLDYQHRIYSIIKRMADKRPAIIMEQGLGEWMSALGYVENVADAIVLAINNIKARNRIYNVAQRDSFNQKQWVEKIGEVFGWKGKVVSVPREKLPEKMQAGFKTEHHLAVDTSRIRNELGYKESVPLEKALAITIEWEIKNPPPNVQPDDFDYKTEDEVLGQL